MHHAFCHWRTFENSSSFVFKIWSYPSKATTSGSVGPSAWQTVPTHTYIHITGPGRSMVYTAADPGPACPRAESPKFRYFLIFHQPKRVLSTRSSKSPELYPIKTCFVFKRVQICNFCLRRARPGIRRPWTCSCSHTYMQCSDPQIHLLWPILKYY